MQQEMLFIFRKRFFEQTSLNSIILNPRMYKGYCFIYHSNLVMISYIVFAEERRIFWYEGKPSIFSPISESFQVKL